MMEDWENRAIKIFEKQLTIGIVFIIIFIVGYFLGNKDANKTPPVEEIVKTDSLIKINDSIKIVINNLDSIKDAKIIEVQTLNNDTTLKLFYELIK